jgi:hypothetical protein
MHLHIIAFDIPFPADYGGVIDIYYKIKWLHKLGVKVHLHCFKYNRNVAQELNEICERVYYYNRSLQKKQLFNKLPFVVISRANEELMQQLLQDDYPVLFEGLHTCYFLNDKRISRRLKLVRMHNVEHEYYKQLGKRETFGFKKIYFMLEAKKLKNFETILNYADYILAISSSEANVLASNYKQVLHVGAFHANDVVHIPEGIGNYCLYHGNLSVIENESAAMYLVENVFSKIKISFVIAGKNPSIKLKKAVARLSNIQLKANVSGAEMSDLIKNAQINILPAFQSTGIKLKLLNALNNGRHCIVNKTMIEGSDIDDLCVIKNSPQEIIETIKKLYEKPLAEADITKRKLLLSVNYSNKDNAQKIIDLLKDGKSVFIASNLL